MRKILLALILVSFLVWPTVNLLAVKAPGERLEIYDPLETITRIIDFLFYFLLVAAVIAIIIAAFHFVTAAGDPEKVKIARSYVIYALVGVIVALLSKGLVELMKLVGVK